LKLSTLLFTESEPCSKLHSPGPPISNQALCLRLTSPKQFFTGRENEISFLCEHVQNARKGGERGICTIHSMGGVCKTQLALECAYRFRAELDCVFRLTAEYGPRLAQVLAEIWTAVAGEAGSGPGRVAPSPPTALPDNVAATVLRTKEWLRVTGKHRCPIAHPARVSNYGCSLLTLLALLRQYKSLTGE
jgi:hypothetical protein